MKLAVISDIHGNLFALEAVLNAIEANEVDKTWVLGDIAAHGPHPAECVAVIRERHLADEKNFQVIGGNTDRYLVTNARPNRKSAKDEDTYREYAEKFQVENDIYAWATAQLGWENYEFLSKIIGKEVATTIDGYGIVMGYHAIPGDDEYSIMPDTPDEETLDSVLDRPLRMGIYGHIHRQVNRQLGDIHLVNPGSIGMSFESPGVAQYAIITFTNGSVSIDMHNLPYDVDQVVQQLAEAEHPQPAFVEAIYRQG